MTATTASQQHILAIDNSQAVLDLFRELLEGEGYRVSIQSYVDKDLDAIKGLAPDLIILDYMWGAEDGGWSLLQLLRLDPSTKDIPIVLCTGAVAEASELEPHLSEMSVRVVLKPFDLDDLLGAIRNALDSHATGV